MKTGWLIPDHHLNELQKKTFTEMMQVISHGGQIDICARVDGKDYEWQCDGLAHAERQEKAVKRHINEEMSK